MDAVNRDSARKGKPPQLCLTNGERNFDNNKSKKESTPSVSAIVRMKNLARLKRGKRSPSKSLSPTQNGTPSYGSRGNEEITFLVEVVKANIPKRQGGKKKDDTHKRGMHCTAYWVGPTNPSGHKRREKFLHRTETLKIKSTSSVKDVNNGSCPPSPVSIDSSDSGDDGDEADEAIEFDCTEHIFTINDSSLFLFRTTMKQLVNASIDSNLVDGKDVFNSGGLRIDIFDKPLDMLSSLTSTVMADNILDKEANAVTRDTSKSTSYRLVGSVFLTPDELLSKCDEQRFECDLVENWRKIQREQQKEGKSMSAKTVDGGHLALRIRPASEFDVNFLRTLALNKSSGANALNATLQSTLFQSEGDKKQLKPAQLITEADENILAAETSMKALGNLSPIAAESMRYMFSKGAEKRLLVKPYPDPERPEETTWLTEEGLHHECYKPSSQWIQAGHPGESSLGQVYLEVLECRGLPNTDAGGEVGNKTDAFISLVYGDIMVQTEVIDDSCSPMWMPWSSRAFALQMRHPSTAIFIGVADYDFGPLDHECIGRVAIHLGKFIPGTLYTLTYNLFESSNLTEKGEDFGTITLRLRIEIPDEKKYLKKGWEAPSRSWVNSQQYKSHRVAKYSVDGRHDEEVFEMSLFRSHINEIMTTKRYISYGISDGMRSLMYWRGQVKVGNVRLPLHSAVVFYFSVHVVEKPHLLPSFLLFGCGWLMIANMLQQVGNPNPWHRGRSFVHYWNVLTRGQSYHSKKGILIKPLQGHKEASRLEAQWNQRLADDDAKWAKQAELDAKVKSISDDAVIRTKSTTKANVVVDPISNLAGPKLLPYQQRLSGYCDRIRYIRNVLNWNESIISFFITLILFVAAFVALFVPWGLLLKWTSRVGVWVFLGPWMRLCDLFFHEETEKQKKEAKKAMKSFQQQRNMAKILRENALKMKPFRVKLFGQFITRLPDFNLTRHEDVPLPESSAEPYQSEEPINMVKFIPSQDLAGAMIPTTGEDPLERQARRQKEKEGLVGEYKHLFDEKPPHLESSPSREDELDEGYELIGTEDDRIVCLHSESTELATTEQVDSTEIMSASSNSCRDVAKSDKTIQLALDSNQLQPHQKEKTQTKWIFSASLRLSLTQRTIEEENVHIPALCDSPRELIEQNDDVAEEGVEIVPFLGTSNALIEHGVSSELENDGDRVAVFHLNEADTQKNSSDVDKTNDDEARAKSHEKKIRFKEIQEDSKMMSKSDKANVDMINEVAAASKATTATARKHKAEMEVLQALAFESPSDKMELGTD